MAKQKIGDVAKAPSQSPYQLNVDQTRKACEVVLKHMTENQGKEDGDSRNPNLLLDEDDTTQDAMPLWLIVSTKKHMTDHKRLLPNKIQLPHSLNTSSTSSICLITADPQRTYKDLIASSGFPEDLRSRITRVIGLSKLKARYKPFENRRQLFAEHDIFLADDRVATYLPQVLGKAFYKSGSKRPIPVKLMGPPKKDAEGKNLKRARDSLGQLKRTDSGELRNPLSADSLAKELHKAIQSAPINLAPGTSTAVKAAHSGLSAVQCADNITVIIEGLTAKYITKGWRNIRAIHVKGPNTPAFPIWLASELWVDDGDVLQEKRSFGKKKTPQALELGNLEGETALQKKDTSSPGAKKRKVTQTDKTNLDARHVKKKRKEEVQAAESTQRKERFRKQKAEIKAAIGQDDA